MTMPRTTSFRNGLICITLMMLSIIAKMRTPPSVPTSDPLPPARSVPPRTTAAMESRSYPPWDPIVGLPTPSRAASSSPARPAMTEQMTWAATIGVPVRIPDIRATRMSPPTAYMWWPRRLRVSMSSTAPAQASMISVEMGTGPMPVAPMRRKATGVCPELPL